MSGKEKKEIENQIEKDRDKHERDFHNLSKIGKCPKCGGEFDEGYIAILKSNWSESRFGLAYLGLKKRARNH